MLEKDSVSVDTLRRKPYMKTAENQVMPMMPLRGMLVFPNLMVHLDAGRDRSINAIEESLTEEENLIFLSMQKDAVTDEPELDDIYQIGTVAQIRQMLKLPGGTVRLLVEGKYRAKMIKVVQEQPYILAEIIPLAEEFGVQPLELEALVRILHHNFAEYAEQSKRISPEVLITIENLEEGDKLSDLVTSQLNIS
ncbi:MAG: LON peptidase substrate-binding domain-containing protein, partial [Clostridiales bacterium]